jgi:hypothetical protein
MDDAVAANSSLCSSRSAMRKPNGGTIRQTQRPRSNQRRALVGVSAREVPSSLTPKLRVATCNNRWCRVRPPWTCSGPRSPSIEPKALRVGRWPNVILERVRSRMRGLRCAFGRATGPWRADIQSQSDEASRSSLSFGARCCALTGRRRRPWGTRHDPKWGERARWVEDVVVRRVGGCDRASDPPSALFEVTRIEM